MDDDGGVAAQLQVDAFEVGRRRGGDLPAGADAPGDGDEPHDGLLDEGAAGVAVAADHVEDAGRQVLGGEAGEQGGRRGGGVRGFEDGGVPGGDRRGDLPHGHHQRVVPRCDLGAHADRFAPEQGGAPLGVLTGGGPRKVPGRAREVAQGVDCGGQFVGAEEGRGLAGVAGFGGRERVGMVLHGVGDAQQGALPFGGGSP